MRHQGSGAVLALAPSPPGTAPTGARAQRRQTSELRQFVLFGSFRLASACWGHSACVGSPPLLFGLIYVKISMKHCSVIFCSDALIACCSWQTRDERALEQCVFCLELFDETSLNSPRLVSASSSTQACKEAVLALRPSTTYLPLRSVLLRTHPHPCRNPASSEPSSASLFRWNSSTSWCQGEHPSCSLFTPHQHQHKHCCLRSSLFWLTAPSQSLCTTVSSCYQWFLVQKPAV